MLILKYILIGYLVICYAFAAFIITAFIKTRKEEATPLWEYVLMLFLPIVIPISIFYFILVLLFDKIGIDIAIDFDKMFGSSKNDNPIPYDPMNDPIQVPQRFSIGFKNLPFTPDRNQVIYVENVYAEFQNNALRERYDEICEWFNRKGFQFLYLPVETSPELMKRRIMSISPEYADKAIYPDALKSDYMLDYLARPENRSTIKPCLIWYDCQDGEETVFHAIHVPKHNNTMYIYHLLSNQIYYERHEELSGIRYRCGDDETEEHLKRAIEEFKNSAKRLAASGITQMMLHQILSDVEPVSRMVITPDYKIFLPDYDNTEIVMNNLPKALYFLFLRYEEGLYLKALSEHEKELYVIYSQLNPHGDEEKMRTTIAEVTKPLSNRPHENISRVNKAIKDALPQYTAQHYLISGTKGDLYSIKLDRKMIEWEE